MDESKTIAIIYRYLPVKGMRYLPPHLEQPHPLLDPILYLLQNLQAVDAYTSEQGVEMICNSLRG